MKIVSENTERVILNNMTELSKDIFGWRAVHIKISNLITDNKSKARQTLEQLVKIFSSTEVQIYLFSDYDLICFYRGIITAKISENIISSLKNINPEISSNEVVKLCNFYDLEKNSGVIKSIISRKIEIKELESKAQELNKIEEKEVHTLDTSNVDSELVKSLQSRRTKNSQIKILLVEDDAFSRRLVKNILQKEYEVIEAENAREAYFKYINFAPHIVFMDINLPDSSGMNLLDNVNAIDSQSFVVMLSGNAFKDNIVTSMEKGAKGFVAKPFPKEKIFGYLEKYKEVTDRLSS